jgi:hypothetical protein
MKCTVQEAKSPVKKILSGSIARRILIPALTVNAPNRWIKLHSNEVLMAEICTNKSIFLKTTISNKHAS